MCVLLYVCRLLHIGRIHMDIDNFRGFPERRQNLQRIQRWYVATGILMTESSLPYSFRLAQINSTEVIGDGIHQRTLST